MAQVRALAWEPSIRILPKPSIVVHVCNPSYLSGENQEDCGLRPARGKEY
jgi:hypothetical protein